MACGTYLVGVLWLDDPCRDLLEGLGPQRGALASRVLEVVLLRGKAEATHPQPCSSPHISSGRPPVRGEGDETPGHEKGRSGERGPFGGHDTRRHKRGDDQAQGHFSPEFLHDASYKVDHK